MFYVGPCPLVSFDKDFQHNRTLYNHHLVNIDVHSPYHVVCTNVLLSYNNEEGLAVAQHYYTAHHISKHLNLHQDLLKFYNHEEKTRIHQHYKKQYHVPKCCILNGNFNKYAFLFLFSLIIQILILIKSFNLLMKILNFILINNEEDFMFMSLFNNLFINIILGNFFITFNNV